MANSLNLIELIAARNFYKEKMDHLSSQNVKGEFFDEQNDSINHLRLIVKKLESHINNYVNNRVDFD